MKQKKLKRPKTAEDLDRLREAARQQAAAEKCVRVCIGTGCAAKGAGRIYELFCEAAKGCANVTVEAKCVGCHGFCERGPIVVIDPDGILYGGVEEPDVEEIFRETVLGGRVVESLLFTDLATGEHCRSAEQVPFYKSQQRIVLAGNGVLLKPRPDPE